MPSNDNNLRTETGALIGGLVVFDYVQGIEDFKTGQPPPDMSSPSYDLGRQRAASEAAKDAAFKSWLKAEDDRRRQAMREILTPAQFAEYERQIAAIPTRKE